MERHSRFVQSTLANVKKAEIELPWTRGKRRSDFITKRLEKVGSPRRTA